jgi:hypothetical protein
VCSVPDCWSVLALLTRSLTVCAPPRPRCNALQLLQLVAAPGFGREERVSSMPDCLLVLGTKAGSFGLLKEAAMPGA